MSRANNVEGAYQFTDANFSAEVLRYAIGIPLQLNHRGSHRAGTVRHVWVKPWGLRFAAVLDGPSASDAVVLLDSPEYVGVSISPLFGCAGERVTEVRAITEISLTTTPACRATFAVMGACSDEPRVPFTWWTGAPPSPWWLDNTDRALIAQGQRTSAVVDDILLKAERNRHHLGQLADRLTWVIDNTRS